IGERGEIHGDIHSEAVIGAPLAHPKTERGDLRFASVDLDVNARGRRLAVGDDAKRREPFYHRSLDPPDERADAHTGAPKIEQQIDDELSRSVIRHLAPAIDLEHGDTAITEDVLRPPAEAERVDGLVLGQPDL